MNFQIYDSRTALTSVQLTTKSWATSSPDNSAEGEWYEVASDRCVRWSGKVLLTMDLTSSSDVSMPAFKPPEDIANIHRQKLVKKLLNAIN